MWGRETETRVRERQRVAEERRESALRPLLCVAVLLFVSRTIFGRTFGKLKNFTRHERVRDVIAATPWKRAEKPGRYGRTSQMREKGEVL